MTNDLVVSEPVSASTRLERSREELRMAMRHAAGLDRPAHTQGLSPAWANGLLATVKSIPGVDLALDVVRRWWANHPLRGAAMVAKETVATVAAPLAQRSPMTLVIGALLAGALMSKLKPWRWLPRSLMFAGLIPQISTRLIASVPLEAWLNALTGTAGRPPAR